MDDTLGPALNRLVPIHCSWCDARIGEAKVIDAALGYVPKLCATCLRRCSDLIKGDHPADGVTVRIPKLGDDEI